MAYTVKAVSELAGVSIRTLHHYDEVGLLCPASVSEAGYRLYSDGDLERLQQVLFFRELGFSLKEIKAIVDRPDFDRKQALWTHRELLLEKQRRLQALIQTIDRSIEGMEGETEMSKKEMFEAFDDAKLEEYKAEAKERWGHTEAYRESERRTSRYTPQDWEEIRAEGGRIWDQLAALMDRDPADEEVQAAIEAWFRHLNDRYYRCTLEIFRNLGEMYVADERFTATYDRVKPGLAVFKRDAMRVYCDRHEGQ